MMYAARLVKCGIQGVEPGVDPSVVRRAYTASTN